MRSGEIFIEICLHLRTNPGLGDACQADHGAKELWILDPMRRDVRVYLLQQDGDRPVQVLKGEDVLRTNLLPGFELSLKRLFP
ncbi:MAG TPA: Uma2 family endonuclease [Chthoniobacterales bacterium]